MSTITINGKTFSVSGRRISIINNKVKVDGIILDTGDSLTGTVNIKFDGDLASLKCDGSAEIAGNVHGDVSAGGSVLCRDVGKDVHSGGSVTCGQVSGDVSAGGSVHCRR